MLMSSVQTEIIRFAVAFCTNIFAAVKAAIQISNTETIDFLFIFIYNEKARVLGLLPVYLVGYSFLVCTVIAAVIMAIIVAIIVHAEIIRSKILNLSFLSQPYCHHNIYCVTMQ